MGWAARGGGWLHLGHRVGCDLAFVLQPGAEHLERAVAVGGGRRLPAGEQIGQERLDLRPVGLGQADAAASQVCLEERTASR
jgi:hypothetical protein